MAPGVQFLPGATQPLSVIPAQAGIQWRTRQVVALAEPALV